MTEEMFHINRLNKRILTLIGGLHSLSSITQELLENPDDSAAGQLTNVLASVDSKYTHVMDSMNTLLSSLTQTPSGDDGITIDAKGSEDTGYEL